MEIRSIEELDAKLTEPPDELVSDIAGLDGDIIILGAGGKMGVTLARLARNAVERAGVGKRIIAVSRFSSGEARQELEAHGVETIAADLLDDSQLHGLPEIRNVIYMIGQKFGTSGREYMTWAMNAYLPGRVAEKYRHSRIVSFSTGNVYPLTPVRLGGASEEHPTGPIGEYAQSCLGRERVFEYFSHKYGTPMLFFRLNYAIDLRYGVLLDIARAVKECRPVDLRMGHVNVIWQGDANTMALRSLNLCSSPPSVLNITGPETVSVRWVAEQFAERFRVEPRFANEEAETALLSNASRAHQLFGYPKVSLRQMIEWIAAWVEAGMPTFDKPTHFQERGGRF